MIHLSDIVYFGEGGKSPDTNLSFPSCSVGKEMPCFDALSTGTVLKPSESNPDPYFKSNQLLTLGIIQKTLSCKKTDCNSMVILSMVYT